MAEGAAQERERDGKLSCTANGQRLVNCARGSNNNNCVCVCVCAKAIIEDALSLRSTRQKLLDMARVRSGVRVAEQGWRLIKI